MNRFPQIAFFALATFAVIFAGATTDRSTVAVLGQPGGSGGCGSSCTVGGHGTGGERSGGAARGFNDRNQTDPRHPGEVINNSGTEFSGHITTRLENGTALGSASGALAPGLQEPEIEVFVGHSTGVFGVCNGPSSKC